MLSSSERTNWRHVILFVGITFLLTWALDLLLYLAGGYTSTGVTTLLQFQMLIPAAVAIGLSIWAFPESPIHSSKSIGRSRTFFYVYLAFTLIYLALGLIVVLVPGQLYIISVATGILSLLSFVFIVAWRFISGRESYRKAGLTFGHPKYWLLFGVAMVLFYALQTGLNALFHLGKPVDISLLAITIGAAMPSTVLVLVIFVQAVLVGPLQGLIFAFGEEYGWRGYLQSELVKIGKRRGILLLGLIWGVWHFPIIWMGHNYPGHPVLGSVLMTLYTIGLAFILGYAVLKSGSVWLAAYLHALNNQVLAFLMGIIYTPSDTTIAFGIGAYGLVLLAAVVLLILRDPLWREKQTPVPPLASESVTQ